MPGGRHAVPVREHTVRGLLFETAFLTAFAIIACTGPWSFLSYALMLVVTGRLLGSPPDQWLIVATAGLILTLFVLLPVVLIAERVIELVRRARRSNP